MQKIVEGIEPGEDAASSPKKFVKRITWGVAY
jgi:hypothetical protein